MSLTLKDIVFLGERTEPPLPPLAFLLLHVDASDASTITKDAQDRLSRWADKSDQLNDFFGIEIPGIFEANQFPVWVDNVLNGLPVITFNGLIAVGQSISTGIDGSPIPGPLNHPLNGRVPQPFTVFTVCKMPSESEIATPPQFTWNEYKAVVWNMGNPELYNSLLDTNNQPRFSPRPMGVSIRTDDTNVVTVTDEPADSDNFHKYMTVFDGVNSSITIDGVLKATGAAGSDIHRGVILGAEWWNDGHANSQIAEFRLYSRLLTQQELDTVNAELDAKWGVLG